MQQVYFDQNRHCPPMPIYISGCLLKIPTPAPTCTPMLKRGDGFTMVLVTVSVIVGSLRLILSRFGSKPETQAV